MAALFAGALLVQLVALTILEIAKHDGVIETAGHERIINRLEAYVPLVEALPASEVEELVRRTSKCHAGYRISAQPFPGTGETPDTRAIGAFIASRLGLGADRVLARYATLDRPDFSFPECSFEEIDLPQTGIVISAQLQDGRWFEAEVHPHEWHYREIAGWITQVGAIFLITAAVALVLLRQLNRPLHNLTEAAQRFGAGLTVSPVEPSGPEDIHRAITTFNTMQETVAEEFRRRTLTLAAISHDIRTPLTALRLRAELVEDEQIRADLLTGIEKLERINTSALDFLQAKSLSEPLRTVDVYSMLESECEDFCELGHQVELTGDHGIYLECRADALARAVRNLIDNAVKYGGSAKVRLQAIGEGVEITVTDPGAGIAEVEMKRALEPFERLSEARTMGPGGFGLGLAVVQAVAKGHGAAVEMSRGLAGFTVTLRIPGRVGVD